MASKKFDNIGGVVLKRIEDGKRCLSAPRGETNKYEITSRGDTIFEIDVENRKINRCVAKYVCKERGGMIMIRYCDAMANRDFIPDYDTFYGRHIPNDMKTCSVMYNKSTYGLMCTNMNDAVDKLQKIIDGKYFGALKEGDKIYVVNKQDENVTEETVERISYNNHWHNEGRHFNIETEVHHFDCYRSEYEENASAFSDESFYTSMRNVDNKKISIHLDKAVAEKVLREYLNSRKNIEKKKAETLKIPIGTPIRHKDNKEQDLHYGDFVAYVRKDYWGHTDISNGVIVGDSEKKIKIFDQEEKEYMEKKELHLTDKSNFGVHMLEPVNILLVKLAK